MAYNEKLANRIRVALAEHEDVVEKSMFRGVTFMVKGKMCISVGAEEILCRTHPALHEEVIEEIGVREMIHGGKIMKGFVFVREDVLRTERELAKWIKRSLDFNPFAKASKKADNKNR